MATKTPCTTINKVCASGMKSAMFGAQSIQLGQNDLVIAGGMENMSSIPFTLAKQDMVMVTVTVNLQMDWYVMVLLMLIAEVLWVVSEMLRHQNTIFLAKNRICMPFNPTKGVLKRGKRVYLKMKLFLLNLRIKRKCKGIRSGRRI